MTTSEPLYVSSPTTVRTSPFARTCQATHLLGRLIRHLNDQNVEPAFRFSEAGQLIAHLPLSPRFCPMNSKPRQIILAPPRPWPMAACSTFMIHTPVRSLVTVS